MSLSLTNDYIFRYVFGRPESIPMLQDLVNAVLTDVGSRPVVSLELKNPVNTRDAYWSKETVLDIKAMGEDKRMFDIEMQVSEDRNFANRSLYYWSQAYAKQLERGEHYEKLRPVICINLLGFVLFRDTPESHHHFIITDEHNPERHLTEDMHIHFVEVCKDMYKNTPLAWWAELFEKSNVEGADMKVLLSRSTTLAKAYEDFEYCKQNSQMREAAMAREKFLMDERSRLADATQRGLEDGRAQGLAEGKAEGKAEVALRMLERGMALGAIADITGLPLEELQKLVGEHPAG
jgi:predicted transposase/invertase (TIGR01784 family)